MFAAMLEHTVKEKLPAAGLDYVQRMMNAAARMQALIRALLTYSRVSSKQDPFTLVDLRKSVDESLADLDETIKRSSGRVEIGALPAIEADPVQMTQLFQNLIGNALKFRRNGEPPVVKIDSRITDAPDGRQGKFCEVSVKDNGIGFDEKYLETIFRPFERLHTNQGYEGTGMGLSICAKIVERHGGTISARSAPGTGSTFVFKLPVEQKHTLPLPP